MRRLSSFNVAKSSPRSRRRALRARRLKSRAAARSKPPGTERREWAVRRDNISRWTVRSRKRPRRARTRSTRRASRRTDFRAPKRSTACRTDRSRREAVRRSWTASSIDRRPRRGRPFRTRFPKVLHRLSSESMRNCPGLIRGTLLAAFRRRTRGSLRRTVPSAVFSRRGRRLLLRTLIVGRPRPGIRQRDADDSSPLSPRDDGVGVPGVRPLPGQISRTTARQNGSPTAMSARTEAATATASTLSRPSRDQ